jgi:hypothetical protein
MTALLWFAGPAEVTGCISEVRRGVGPASSAPRSIFLILREDAETRRSARETAVKAA